MRCGVEEDRADGVHVTGTMREEKVAWAISHLPMKSLLS